MAPAFVYLPNPQLPSVNLPSVDFAIQNPQSKIRIGVDTGGTFTDLVLDPGPPHALLAHKVLSSPGNPAQAVLQGIAALLDRWRTLGSDEHPPALDRGSVQLVIHGSTVATNALLEGKGARAAFVTTAGFEDTLHIARQNRPDLYALSVGRPAPPVPRDRCLGVAERVLYDGSVRTALDEAETGRLVARLAELEVEAVAISLLHSYANPDHERRLAKALRQALPDVLLTVSHELLPEFREYERAATCVINAVVAPSMTGYIGHLADELPLVCGADPPTLRIMASSGGSVPPDEVRRAPVQTILSGPAGGVVGAWSLARAAGFARIITLDMGGTSTDVALCDEGLTRTTETEVAGLPIRLSMADIHTVGAGGGSIAWIDTGGALHAGPQSAGADPGPACYGRQGAGTRRTGPLQATVTDAHVVLGHLPADQPLGGDLVLDTGAAFRAVKAVAEAIGLAVEEAALGILRVAEATMARAVQRMSVQRGHDPRRFVLMPFGGAGGLHACRLASTLGMTRVLVPRFSGVLSALGMLASAPLYTFSQSLLLRVDPAGEGYPDLRRHGAVRAAHTALHRRAEHALEAEALPPAERVYEPALDLRYQGQAYELTVPFTPDADPIAAFIERHRHLYGYIASGKPVEVVTVRLRASGIEPPLRLETLDPRPETGPEIPLGTQRVYAAGAWHDWRRVPREALRAGDRVEGPLIVTEEAATTLVSPGWTMTVHEAGHLVLDRASGKP